MKRLFFVLAVGLGFGVVGAAWAQLPLADRPMPSTDGRSLTLAQLQGSRGLVVVFWSNRCPWVDRYEARLKELAETYEGRGIRFVLVNANDAGAFPQESLEASAAQARRKGYTLPYVRDEGSTLAQALGASRTPEVFVFTAQGRLLYRGAIDDSPGDAANVQQAYLREALEALLQGRQPAITETSPFGCLIRFSERGP